MHLEKQNFARLLAAYQELKLISEPEIRETLALFDAQHPLSGTLAAADSLHVHVKVDDTAVLPRAKILALGATPESEQAGYVKFAHANGLNMIFSSIDVSVEDLIKEAPKAPKPHLDHLGIDLRSLEPPVVALFNEVPAIARGQQWAHVSQGGSGQPVYCCHTEVSGKHWVFPRNGGSEHPIEVASGPLTVHGAKMGCDLRPIDPDHPLAGKATCCAAAALSAGIDLVHGVQMQNSLRAKHVIP